MMPESLRSDPNGPVREVLGWPFAANHQPMWISDLGTHGFLDVNQAALKQYGYSRAEFLGMSTFNLRSGSEKQLSDPLLKAPRTAEPYIHKSKDGQIFPVAITSWQKLTFNGRPAELALVRKTDSLLRQS